MSFNLNIPPVPRGTNIAHLQRDLEVWRLLLINLVYEQMVLGCGMAHNGQTLSVHVDGETIVCTENGLMAVAVNDGAIGGTTSYDTLRLAGAA